MLSHALFAALIFAASIGSSSPAPERYELCTNQTEIDALQATFGLIAVMAIPPKAAMHPSWPETLIGISLFFVTGIVYLVSGGPELGQRQGNSAASTKYHKKEYDPKRTRRSSQIYGNLSKR
jgi:hypothetical protein